MDHRATASPAIAHARVAVVSNTALGSGANGSWSATTYTRDTNWSTTDPQLLLMPTDTVMRELMAHEASMIRVRQLRADGLLRGGAMSRVCATGDPVEAAIVVEPRRTLQRVSAASGLPPDQVRNQIRQMAGRDPIGISMDAEAACTCHDALATSTDAPCRTPVGAHQSDWRMVTGNMAARLWINHRRREILALHAIADDERVDHAHMTPVGLAHALYERAGIDAIADASSDHVRCPSGMTITIKPHDPDGAIYHRHTIG